MVPLILSALLAVLFIASWWAGYRQFLRLEHLNRSILSNTFITAITVLTLLTVAHWFGYFPQGVAAQVTMGLYTLAAGFFFGNGNKLVLKKIRAGDVEYMHRSFWIDIAPNLVAVFLVAFGIFRTGLLSLGPYTGIGITSGLSLIGFGFFGWTVRIVPEFRTKGILILDQFIEWKHVISYEWFTDGAITIDYMNGERKVCEFSTSIPPEDQLLLERLLGRRLKEHEEERKKELQNTGEY